mmetsp:Transcript_30488/g.46014  ORF Transcript_30488/g.46014 Transcript_30488/m.46014 type:complete len:239 (+) Transcript_30488:104-820(+)
MLRLPADVLGVVQYFTHLRVAPPSLSGLRNPIHPPKQHHCPCSQGEAPETESVASSLPGPLTRQSFRQAAKAQSSQQDPGPFRPLDSSVEVQRQSFAALSPDCAALRHDVPAPEPAAAFAGAIASPRCWILGDRGPPSGSCVHLTWSHHFCRFHCRCCWRSSCQSYCCSCHSVHLQMSCLLLHLAHWACRRHHHLDGQPLLGHSCPHCCGQNDRRRCWSHQQTCCHWYPHCCQSFQPH